jgi:AIPR protein
MDVGEFRANLISEVNVWATADQNFRHSSFVEIAVRYLEDAGEVADFESCYFRGIGARRRALAVDGFAFDGADGSLRLFLADASLAAETPSLTQTEATALFGRLRAFAEEAFSGRIEEDIDPSSPAWGLAAEMRERRRDLTRIRAYLLSDAALSSRARDWPEGEVADVPIEFHVWDIERLHRVHTSLAGRDEITIDFERLDGGGLPCIDAGSVENEYRAFLCVVPGPALADVYDEYGSRLLEGNVRSFLTAKGRVNKGIRNTALHDPRMFFAYNNGIAATASAADVRANGDGGMRLASVTDLQIVNGAQTTASLAAARRNDKASLDGVFVQMKLSIVSPERSGEMIPKISRFANSQNTVSEADFFSNHEFHRRLEEISRRIWVPARAGAQHETHWFYERARGQYMNATFASTPAERRRFQEMNPRDQVLTKTDLAKSENAWRELPHTVSRGAQKNFSAFADYIAKEWDAHPEEFNEDYFRRAVGHVIVFRSTERLVSDQPWYSGGYRANVVAYSVARLARLIRTEARGRVLDARAIWTSGFISDALRKQLVAISRLMHEVITDPPAGVQNVTEWSKREACWERASSVDVELDGALSIELIDASEVKDVGRTARVQQRQDSGIDAQTAVIRLGQPYWVAVRNWARERGYLSPDEELLLRLAAEYQPGMPTDRQSAKLLTLKERFELEGLAPVPIE